MNENKSIPNTLFKRLLKIGKILLILIAIAIPLTGTIIYGFQTGHFSHTDDYLFYIILVLVAVFTVMAYAYIANRRLVSRLTFSERQLKVWRGTSYHVRDVGSDVVEVLPIGIVLYNPNKLTVKWTNTTANKILESEELENKALSEIHEGLQDIVLSGLTKDTITHNGLRYEIQSDRSKTALYLFDVTEREEAKEKYENRLTAFGIIYLDNIEQGLQTFDIYERSSIKGEYLGVINDWIGEYNGFLKHYTEDRIFFSLHYEDLKRAIDQKFDILNQIREISNRHRVRISASIGIACWDIDFSELGTLAQNAIELAEKRGGDQAVVNIEHEKIAYFGGRTSASEKFSKVQVRVHTQNLKDLIESSKAVLVVGHKQSDIDALGAMIGIYRMSVASEVSCKLIIDKEQMDNTVLKILPELEVESPKLFKNMITTETALKLIDDNTLLVVVDTQSPRIIASPEVLEVATRVAVIDHHRHDDMTFDATFSYVESTASSSVELIAEMMEFYSGNMHIEPIEASVMYGGIIVDSNEFSQRTGSRTFGAAAYLQEKQASSVRAKEWLRLDLERTLEINNLISQLVEVQPGFGVVVDKTNLVRDRVLVAQVTDKILEIDGIDAAFTIAKIAPNTVSLSARSYDKVNVQLIAATLGGGGHFGAAGAQVQNATVDEVFERLTEGINECYEEIRVSQLDEEGGKTMKIILLEDIKGKGEKDDIIDVPNGYGNHLISRKRAIKADEKAIEELNARLEREQAAEQAQIDLWNKLKHEIESKSVTITIRLGQDGKMFGSVTTKQIAEALAEQGVNVERRRIELTSAINSVGIYTGIVRFPKDIVAQFEINVLEQRD